MESLLYLHTLTICIYMSTKILSSIKRRKFDHRINEIKLTLRLMWIRVQPLSGTRGFVQYVIIYHQNWPIYTYVDMLLKETMTHIL